MTRKVLMLLCAFALLVVPVQAGTHFYLGGLSSFDSRTTDRFGLGSDLRFGFDIPTGTKPYKLIAWTPAVYQLKTGEGDQSNEIVAGGSLLFPHIVPKLKTGIYASVQLGVGDVEGGPTDFGAVYGGGLYCDLSEAWRVWGGLDNQRIIAEEEVNVWTFYLGVSFHLNGEPANPQQ